jgi:hypothetical protein
MRRPLYSFALDPDLRERLHAIKTRDGISESEQIRRGIRLWLGQAEGRSEAGLRRAGKARRKS